MAKRRKEEEELLFEMKIPALVLFVAALACLYWSWRASGALLAGIPALWLFRGLWHLEVTTAHKVGAGICLATGILLASWHHWAWLPGGCLVAILVLFGNEQTMEALLRLAVAALGCAAIAAVIGGICSWMGMGFWGPAMIPFGILLIVSGKFWVFR